MSEIVESIIIVASVVKYQLQIVRKAEHKNILSQLVKIYSS